jgi:hypothetical protein
LAKVQIPHEFNIGGSDIKVYSGDTLDDALDHDGKIGACSFCPNGSVIGLHSKSTPDIFNHTFWHELTHILNCINLGSELSEGQVAALGSGLHQFMKQVGVQVDGRHLPDAPENKHKS